jgi:hypothetical protein
VSKVVSYRSGQCRNSERAMTHTYADTAAGNLWPMCDYGWNRSDGARFSIFRGPPGTEGDCAICRKNVEAGKRPVINAKPHKTKWL